MSKSSEEERKSVNKLKLLESRKQMLFRRIQKMFDYIKDLNQPNIASYFKISFNSLENTKVEISEIVDEMNLLSLEIDSEFEPNYSVIESVMDLYCHIVEAHKNLIKNGNLKKSTDSTSSVEVQPKLPKIDLVEFSGDPRTWPIFYQNFKTCVHDNSKLDDASKIHYLISKLTGRALNLCSGITPTGANYNTIWNLLTETFQDERLLASTYLKSILDFKPLNFESFLNLSSFLEKFDVSVSALKQLNLNDLSDFLLVSIALSKLDVNTRKLFEMTLKGSEIPSYDNLISFIRQQVKVLSRTFNNTSTRLSVSNSNNSPISSKSTVSYSSSTELSRVSFPYPMCPQNFHALNKCTKFLKMSPNNRYKLVKEKSLCLNCLSSKHKILACKSGKACNICSVRHHSLLHFNQPISSGSKANCSHESEGENSSTSTFNHVGFIGSQANRLTTILPTALIKVTLSDGNTANLRVLLDSGSQDNFISYKCCRKLNLVVENVDLVVKGIGDSSKDIKGIVRNLEISSRLDSDIKFKVDVFVLEKMTSELPTCEVSINDLKFTGNINLADPQFPKCREIDGILGANVFSSILIGNKIENKSNLITALNSHFGYLIIGKAEKSTSSIRESHSFCSVVNEPRLEKQVQRFFELENVPDCNVLDPENIQCENHFRSSYFRDISGRYTVSLPFKIDSSNLGYSFTSALKRFEFLEKRLNSNLHFKQQYCDVIRDYLHQNHMRKVKSIDKCYREDEISYFIPHHAVYKMGGSTPMRIVFDASAKTSSSLSLNDCLHTGSKQQVDILEMFLNFRLFYIAFVADICQMYRQINISEKDKPFQRILWRFNSNENIEIYEITTVAFGVKSSPFLALRVLRQLAIDEAQNYPEASKILLKNMYVDDLVTSVPSLNNASKVYTDIVGILKSGGFNIKKWHTNSESILALIPEEQRSLKILEFDNNTIRKVLGLHWQSDIDILAFNVKLSSADVNSKRSVLSEICRIFDPLGILGPVITTAKLFVRKLWSIELDWDSTLPKTLSDKWILFRNELQLLKKLSIPRWLGATEKSDITLIGFSDASQQAYGAVVYARIVYGNHVRISLVCAKSKIAPLKTVQTIPRLELCAALLLSNLMKYILETYRERCKIEKVLCFIDSQIVLGWIAESPHKWKTFVANRVARIQNNLPKCSWYFVSGENNIADQISRGSTPSQFMSNCSTWLNGPEWLKRPFQDWPVQSWKNLTILEKLLEQQIIALVEITHQENDNIVHDFVKRFSSFSKLLNSRPLCSYYGEDPTDPEILTPAHFTQTSISSLPAIDVSNRNIHLLHRKQLLDNIVQPYWHRWKNEYLQQLQVRSKWNTDCNPIKVGAVVLVINENTTPLKWPLGVVTKMYPGVDHVVRIVDVKTKSSLYKRPVVKLCPLPTQ